MPTTLEVTYSKKLGLPNFSSHCCSITIRTEVEDVSQAQAQAPILYKLLQTSVDEEMQDVGYLPDPKQYGKTLSEARVLSVQTSAEWACTLAQKAQIVGFVEKRGVKKRQVDDLAKEMHGIGVCSLNRKQAAGFIRELMKRFGTQITTNGAVNNT